MSDWILKLPWDVINVVGIDCGVDPRLLGALVQVESRGNPFLCKYEPGYNEDWLVDPPGWAKKHIQSLDTEWVQQKTSWGLIQIMGGTARWLGFEHAIPVLTNPYVGLSWGCRYFTRQQRRYDSVYAAIAAYNRGSLRLKKDGTLVNQEYVDRVRDFAIELDLHIPKDGPPTRGKVLPFKKP